MPISVEFSGLDSRSFERKEIDASGLSNAERRALIGQTAMNQIFFSSKVSDARLLELMQDYIARGARGESGYHRDDFIKKMRAHLGMASNESAGNSIEEISSFQRLKLIYEFNLARIAGQIQYATLAKPEMREAFPALELYRAERRKEPRNWIKRWRDAGGKFYDGGKMRMIAPVGDDIWLRISAFSEPYPPFDFNSGMGLRTIARKEAERLGVIEREQKEAKPEPATVPALPAPSNVPVPAETPKNPQISPVEPSLPGDASVSPPETPKLPNNEGVVFSPPTVPKTPKPTTPSPLYVPEGKQKRPRIIPLDGELVEPDPAVIRPIEERIPKPAYVIVGPVIMLTGMETEEELFLALVLTLAKKTWKLVFKPGISTDEKKLAKVVVDKAQTKRFEKATKRYVFRYSTSGNKFYAEGKVKDADTLEISYIGRMEA